MRTAARPLLSIALVASALAATGCEPVMEVYMSPGEELGVDKFGRFDEIHTIIFLRGGDQNTRIRFRVGSAVVPQPFESRPYNIDRTIYPRPTADQLGAELTLDIQHIGPPIPEPVAGLATTDPATAGPWAPGPYDVRVVLEDAESGEEIQVEDVDFVIE